MGILPASVFVYHVRAWCPERGVDPQELKLKSVWGTEDGNQGLWRSSQ